jgi:hypothetical protein
MNIEFDMLEDLTVLNINPLNGETGGKNIWPKGAFIEVDVYFIGKEFVLACDDYHHMAIPKRKLMKSMMRRIIYE